MLDKYLDDLKNSMISFEVTDKSVTAREMFSPSNNTVWMTTTPYVIDEDVVKLMILRIPVTIYVHETQTGDYYVVKGGNIVETLRQIAKQPMPECLALQRRIIDNPIKVVVFRCSMSIEDVDSCVKFLQSIDS